MVHTKYGDAELPPLGERSDEVLLTPDDEGDEYSLAPPEGKSRTQFEREAAEQTIIAARTSPLANPPSDTPLRLQFSTFQLFALMTLIAIGLGAATWLPPGILAGFCGFAALVVLLLSAIAKPQNRILGLAWIVWIVLYSVLALVAIVRLTVDLASV